MKEIKICKMKLSDFATVIMGQSPSSNFYNEEGKGLPFFQGVTDFSYKYPNETFWTTVAPKKAEINDVLFSVRAPVGDVNIANKKCCIGRGIAAIRSKTNQIDYLYYLLKYQSIKIQRLGTGAVYDAIKKSDLENILLDVFEDPNSQFQVGSLLVLYDDLIGTNRRRIQLLEEAARLLFREWFVYFRFPGHEKVKIVDGVPEGWKKEHLSKLVSTQYGYTETASQEEIGPKFLRGKDINKNSYVDWSSVPYCSNKKLDFRKYSLSRGDILIIRMADPGKVGIVEVEIEAIFASYLVRLKVINKSISSYYLFYSLSNDKYQGFITGSSTGSTRKSASAKLLVDYYLLIPKKEIIDSFGEQIIPIRKKINILLQQNQKLAQARDLLLPRLMSGAIEV